MTDEPCQKPEKSDLKKVTSMLIEIGGWCIGILSITITVGLARQLWFLIERVF